MMPVSTFQSYILSVFANIPREHWAVMGLSSLVLTAILILRKKSSIYGAICIGISVLLGLFLLDAAVFNRYFGTYPQATGFIITFHRLFHNNEHGQFELLANIVGFIPIGFFLSESLASTKRYSIGRRLGLATLAGFGLSLCIECLQLLLRVGFFELTDLVLNTVGGVFGAMMAIVGRALLALGKR